MNLQDIDDRYNKSITALKSLEQILKGMDASYDVHITRLSWLKHLADSCADLRRAEVEALRSSQIAAQVAQQAASHAAQQAAKAAEQVVKQEPVTAPAPAVEESVKKTKKKVE